MATIYCGLGRHCRSVVLASSLSLVLLLAACGGGGGGSAGGGSGTPPPAAVSAQLQVPALADIAKALKFTAKVNNPSNLSLQYLWEFGDGQSSALAEPEHQYAAVGEYTITLTVSSSEGKTSQSSKLSVGVFTGLEGLYCSGAEPMQGWCRQSYLPTNSWLRSVKMVNATVGWAVGDNGTVVRTLDGGQSWAIRSLPQASDISLSGIAAVDETTAWVAGDTGLIAKTIDGGKTWQVKPTGASNKFLWITAIDRNTLWAKTPYEILRSTDGGASWVKSIPSNDSVAFIDKNVSAPSANVAWVSTRFGVYRTEDGGARWKQSSLADSPTIASLDSQTAWAVDSALNLKKTTDGGLSWSSWPIRLAGYYSSYGSFIDLQAISANELFLLGENGKLFRTTDGGLTWTDISPVGLCDYCSRMITSVSAVSTDAVVLVGGAGTIFTKQAGKPWASGNRGIPFIYGDIVSPVVVPSNVNEAIVPVQDGIYQTMDGGQNWVKKNSHCVKELHKLGSGSLVAISCDLGPPSFATSTDKGDSWKFTPYANLSMGPTSLAVAGDNVVWAVGANWTVRAGYGAARSLDGGNTWEATSVIATSPLSTIAAIDDKVAWVGGDNGVIYVTRDGGKTWALQTTGVAGSKITSLLALSATTAWATSSTEAVLATKDGGASWVAQGGSETKGMNAIASLDGKMLWAVGAKGRVIRSVDGGASWTAQASGTTDILLNITPIDNSTAWVAGINSTVLKTATGGK